ncbi:MAG: hypothetical protein KAS32_30165 [Candidatus Peribacteraceae bacterium]|nr:hypothetical protein [Candidatus Peribacteraceae bacterium]
MEIITDKRQIDVLKLLFNLEGFVAVREAQSGLARETIYQTLGKVTKLKTFDDASPVYNKVEDDNVAMWQEFKGDKYIHEYTSSALLRVSPIHIELTWMLANYLDIHPSHTIYEVCNCFNLNTNAFEYRYVDVIRPNAT